MPAVDGFETLTAGSGHLPASGEKLVLFRIPKDVDISKLSGIRVNLNENKSQPLEIKSSSNSNSSSSSGSTNLVMYRDLDSNSILRPIVLNNKNKAVVGQDFTKTFVIAHDYATQLGFAASLNASIEKKKEDLPVDPAYSKIEQYPNIRYKFNTTDTIDDNAASTSASSKKKRKSEDASRSSVVNNSNNFDDVEDIEDSKKSKKKKDKK